MRGFFLLIAGLLIFAGCPRKKTPPPKSQKSLTLTERIARGKAQVQRLQCKSCHSIEGHGGDNGPDLTGVGKKYIDLKGSKEKARIWFVHHIEDPEKYPGVDKKKYPTVKMQSVKTFTSKEDRKNVALYLLSLK